ncbi:hypothetical protein V5O48_007604, partial [Marasmius crinis-equi]
FAAMGRRLDDRQMSYIEGVLDSLQEKKSTFLVVSSFLGAIPTEEVSATALYELETDISLSSASTDHEDVLCLPLDDDLD